MFIGHAAYVVSVAVGINLLFTAILSLSMRSNYRRRWHFAVAAILPLMWVLLTGWLLSGHGFDQESMRQFGPMIMAPLAMLVSGLAYVWLWPKLRRRT